MAASAVHQPILSRREPTLGTRTLIIFLALTFAISWGVPALLLLFAEQITAIFGEMSTSNLVFILVVYTPGFTGIFLIWRNYGLKGLGSFFRRLTLWRASKQWYLFLLLGIPAIVYTAAAIKGSINDPFPFSPWYLAFPALPQALFLGPIEEFGWRGLALPLLQHRFAPVWAGLIFGIIWAAWHTPAFFFSGTPQSAWAFGPFFAGIVAISVILTPLFNSSKGSLLIASILVVFFNRRTMFHRGSGITEVLVTGE